MQCRYCHNEFSKNVEIHEKRCALSPDLYQVTRQALDDGTGTIVPQFVYRSLVSSNAVSYMGLYKNFGNWRNVAKVFDLRFHENVGRRTSIKIVDANRVHDGMNGAESVRITRENIEQDEREKYQLAHYRVVETDREIIYSLR